MDMVFCERSVRRQTNAAIVPTLIVCDCNQYELHYFCACCVTFLESGSDRAPKNPLKFLEAVACVLSHA
jgi:hypothetical protein